MRLRLVMAFRPTTSPLSTSTRPLQGNCGLLSPGLALPSFELQLGMCTGSAPPAVAAVKVTQSPLRLLQYYLSSFAQGLSHVSLR